MKFTINIDLGEGAGVEKAAEAKPKANDVWRFNEIRETLWGKGASKGLSSKDMWDMSGIRNTLWGK